MATISNLFVDAGSDYSIIVTIKNSAGSAYNLTNYVIKSQMRKSYSSSLAYDFNASVYDASNGKIKLALTAANSELIPPGRWLYDVEITQGATGPRKRVLEGIVTVTPQITQT